MLWLTFFIHHYHKTIYFRVAICFKFLFKQQFARAQIEISAERFVCARGGIGFGLAGGKWEIAFHIVNSLMHLQRGVLRLKDPWLQRTLDKLICSRLFRQLGVVMSLLLDECPSWCLSFWVPLCILFRRFYTFRSQFCNSFSKNDLNKLCTALFKQALINKYLIFLDNL